MDKRNRNIIALGLLTVIGAFVFVWGLYFMLGTPILGRGNDLVVALPDGAGLKRGDRVNLMGVEVGSVTGVRLTPANLVVAELRIRDDIVLPADTRAAVTGDVFGAHSVDLRPGTSLVRLQPGDTIAGAPLPALPELAAALGAQARSVLTAADSLLSPATVADVRATTAVLPSSAEELRAAFVEIRLAATALRRSAESIEAANTGTAVANAVAEVERSAQALTAAAVSMDRSLGSIASVMAKIDDGEGTLGRLVNDASLYDEFQQTVREMSALATDIRERPRRYINLRIF